MKVLSSIFFVILKASYPLNLLATVGSRKNRLSLRIFSPKYIYRSFIVYNLTPTTN